MEFPVLKRDPPMSEMRYYQAIFRSAEHVLFRPLPWNMGSLGVWFQRSLFPLQVNLMENRVLVFGLFVRCSVTCIEESYEEFDS